MARPVDYACRIAEHAGWYANYSARNVLLSMRPGCRRSLCGRRGMKLYTGDHLWWPWPGIYMIDGSTCRKRRLVWLAMLSAPDDWGREKWLLVIETMGPGTRWRWRHREYVIDGREARMILACFWRGALIHKTIYPHYEALRFLQEWERELGIPKR